MPRANLCQSGTYLIHSTRDPFTLRKIRCCCLDRWEKHNSPFAPECVPTFLPSETALSTTNSSKHCTNFAKHEDHHTTTKNNRDRSSYPYREKCRRDLPQNHQQRPLLKKRLLKEINQSTHRCFQHIFSETRWTWGFFVEIHHVIM